MGTSAASMLHRLYASLPMGLVVVLTAGWAAHPGVPVLVRGMGLLAAPESRRGFYARGPGEVQALLVSVGEQVRQGQRLVSLDRVGQSAIGPGSQAFPPAPQTLSAQRAALAQQQRALNAQARALDDQHNALQARRHQIETTNHPVRKQLTALEDLRRERVIARYSPLWVGAQDLWLRNRADMASIDGSLAQLRAQRAALMAQGAELQAQRAALESDSLSQGVFSPVGGLVLDLAVQPGQPVAPGQKLGSIGVPSPRPGRQAVVLFTAADASRLSVGDAVRLNPQLLSRDSFGGTEQRYGLVPGRILALSRESVELADVTAEVGSQEVAANLMASARQRSFGDGGDLTSQLPGRAGAPLVLAVVQLEAAATPSGLAWTLGQGPERPLPPRTPAEVEAEVETRSPLSYLLPFWRWMSGSRP
ncbi:MAG: HlyD family efflux transporter periplasmic adaptor subunit [Cyanobium sp.]